MKTKEERKEENRQLKKALCICINKPLVKRLSSAMDRINGGKYYTEEEFFKDSPLLALEEYEKK